MTHAELTELKRIQERLQAEIANISKTLHRYEDTLNAIIDNGVGRDSGLGSKVQQIKDKIGELEANTCNYGYKLSDFMYERIENQSRISSEGADSFENALNSIKVDY